MTEATVLADVIGIRRSPRQEHVHVVTVGFPVAAAVRSAVRAFATTLTQSQHTANVGQYALFCPKSHQQARPSAGSVGRPGVATGLLFAEDEARVAHDDSRFPTPGDFL